jgi:hypothetical protein
MHWRTHERLWWKHHEAEMAQLIGMRKWLDKWRRGRLATLERVCLAVLRLVGGNRKAIVAKSTLASLCRLQPIPMSMPPLSFLGIFIHRH